MLTQALTNLYKNSAEAVLRQADEKDESWQGIIQTSVSQSEDGFELIIRDNGPGWPMTNIDRLLEPYVTTREGGTGLGLPIVKRIIEDHAGTLRLSVRDDRQAGAQVQISLLYRVTDTENSLNEVAAE